MPVWIDSKSRVGRSILSCVAKPSNHDRLITSGLGVSHDCNTTVVLLHLLLNLLVFLLVLAVENQKWLTMVYTVSSHVDHKYGLPLVPAGAMAFHPNSLDSFHVITLAVKEFKL